MIFLEVLTNVLVRNIASDSRIGEIDKTSYVGVFMNTSNEFKCVQDIGLKEKHLHCPSMRRFCSRGFLLHAVAILVFTLVIPATVFSQDDFDTVYDKASLSFRQAKYDDALKFYKKGNRIKKDSSLECLWGMAQTYSKLGAYKNTLKTCDRLIQISGNNLYYKVKAWNLRGNELSALATEKPKKLDQKKLQDAEAAYREVLKLSGSNIAHYNLGITLIRLNRIDEGIGELQVFTRNAEDEALAEKARKIIQEPRRAVENFAPDFSMVTSDGEYIGSDELKGNVLLVDFWGAWCKPCQDAIPFLSKLAKKHREDAFVLISVDENDEEAKWREFMAENKMDWMNTRDGDRKIQRLFQVTAFPTYILIDHEGIILYRGRGSSRQTEDELSKQIKQALKAQAAYQKQQKEKPEKTPVRFVAQPSSKMLRVPGQSALYPNALKTDSAIPKLEGTRFFSFRIPKPSIEVTRADVPNLSSAQQNRPAIYRVSIRNWASMPDDLFETAKGLTACSAGAIVSRPNSLPRRLEIVIKSEQGMLLLAFCDPPQPQVLNNLMFTIPVQAKPEKIYLTLKDRLTGNSVQSELVTLPLP